MRGNQHAAALIVASGGTQQQAAIEGGVSPRTIRRWLNDDPQFAALVDQVRRDAFATAYGVLCAGAAEAARRLVSLAVDPHPNASARLGACRSVLTLTREYAELFDLETRVDALEERTGSDVDRRIEQLTAELERRARWEAEHPEGKL